MNDTKIVINKMFEDTDQVIMSFIEFSSNAEPIASQVTPIDKFDFYKFQSFVGTNTRIPAGYIKRIENEVNNFIVGSLTDKDNKYNTIEFDAGIYTIMVVVMTKEQWEDK